MTSGVFRRILRLFKERGGASYTIGEPLTQAEHAVKSALRLQSRGRYLQTAALLHDVGHLLEDEATTACCRKPSLPINPKTGVNDFHELRGARCSS